MKSGFKQFKLEEWIRSADDLVALLNDALTSANQKFLLVVLGAASANQKFLLVVLGAAAKRQGLDQVAQRAHLERSELEQLLSETGNPSWEQFWALCQALNIRLQAKIEHSA